MERYEKKEIKNTFIHNYRWLVCERGDGEVVDDYDI